MSLGLVIALAVFGAAILAFGIYVRRSAEKTTRDAHADLEAMFGSSMPQLFAQPFTSGGARITGLVAIVAGALLLVAALLLLVLT
ncbi:hypothetical protein BH11ACT4_BH11ACT4_13770 [soil metagenome]